MQRVAEECNLGDIISEDGRNSKNIKDMISKGLGIFKKNNEYPREGQK